jgi:hypothetical protein
MILFDIDDTISPTRVEEAPVTDGETARAGGFELFIPQHLLDFMRGREDIVLLSTWGLSSFAVSEAFGFHARVAVISDFTEKVGSAGKFEVVKALKPLGWADDHIKPAMKKFAIENGAAVTVPKKGYVTAAELTKFAAAVAELPARDPQAADSLLRSKVTLD